MSKKTVKLISIIIPSYNSNNTIETTLNKIFELNNLEILNEVIVVDSSDDVITKELINKFKNKGVICLTSGIKVMPAIQRNIGARHAKGEVLAFIDSDAYPEKNWLKNISESYLNGNIIGGGGYLIPEFQIKNKVVLAQYYLEFSEFLPFGKNRVKNMVPTCNLYCKKDFYHKIGGIPEIRASEDSLFGLKASKFRNIIFNPQILVYHIFRENEEHFIKNQRLLGKYIYEYRKKQKKYLDNKSIALSLYPLIMIFKVLRIYIRVSKLGIVHFFRLQYCFPVFIKGVWFWGIEFRKSILTNKN